MWKDMPEPSDTLLLNYDEVAEHLRVSRRYVEQMVARGDLIAVRIGGNVRVRRFDLETYIDKLPFAHARDIA
jgi:excisionase family DNA binding protein